MNLADIKQRMVNEFSNYPDFGVEFYKDLLLALASNPSIATLTPDLDAGCNMNVKRNTTRIINQADAIIKQLESDSINKER